MLALRALAPPALAVAGGVLWGLCHGREPMLLLPWAALVPLLLLLSRRRPGLLGFCHGLATWLTAIPWIQPTLVTYGQMPRALSAVLLVGLCAYLGSFHAVFTALAARLWRRSPGLALGAAPALWVALEWLRGHLFGGFPWNLAAYAAIDTAGALPLAAWIGAHGVSYLLLFAAAGLALAVERRRADLALVGLFVPLLLLAAGGRWAVPEAPAAAPPMPVRILQPNTANLVAFDAGIVGENLRQLIAMSEAACDRPGALLVWPESAAWPFAYGRDVQFSRAVDELAARGCSILLNAAREESGRVYNAAFLVGAGLAPGRYDKRHLVPWGEYVPLKEILPFVGKLARNAGDFSPAEELALLDWRGERIGMSICFEVVFPEEVAAGVRAGATLLSTITNDAWYGDTAAPWQHFRAARFRAAENRRPLLRAAITGVSALVAADGRVAAQLGVGERGTLRGAVAGRRDVGPYSRWPWLVPAAAALAAGLALLSTSTTLTTLWRRPR